MAKRYTENNKPLTQNFSKSFLQEYETLCVEVLDSYRLKSEQVEDLLAFWQGWDNYALSIMYLRILFYLNITEKGVSYTENTFVSSFTEILLQNIHPDPRRRLTIQDTRSNKKRLHRVVLEDQEALLKLEKRYTQHA